MLLEVCANSYESALNAEKAGADRIELCTELFLGGITPSYGLIEKVKSVLNIPVHVLIRPRSGNFTYSDAEFDIMKYDITQCKKLGCEGIVSGVLLADNSIDTKRTKILIEHAAPLSFTFHRAFDWVSDPEKASHDLISIGVNRLLSSGLKEKAIEGIDLLKKLHGLARNRMIVMPGAGVNASNILAFKAAGFTEVHFSASSQRKTINTSPMPMASSISFDERIISFSDPKKIKSIKGLVN